MRAFITALALALLLPLAAHADNEAQDTPAEDAPPVVVVTRDADGRKVFRFQNPFVLRVRAQLPRAVYILQRTPLGDTLRPLDTTLVPRIHDTTRQAPF